MYKYSLLSSAALASAALWNNTADAQEILDTAPAPPVPVQLDTVADCAGAGPIVCEGGVDVDGVGSADPGAEIIIRGDALVEAAAGPALIDPTFVVGAILEGPMSSVVVEEGGQVVAVADFSFGVVDFAFGNEVTIAGDVISNGAAGGAVGAFGADGSIVVAGSGVVFSSGDSSAAITAVGGGQAVAIDGLVQTQGEFASGVLVGFGPDIQVSISETGQVIAEGDFSPALSTFVTPFESSTRFENAGLVLTFGDGAQAVALATSGASVSNTGAIATIGDGSPGALLLQSNHVFENLGVVSTAGGDLETTYEEFLGLAPPGAGVSPITLASAGLLVGNGGSTIINSGDITAANGPGIQTSAEFAALTNASFFGTGDASAPITITNAETGTISGTIGILGSDLIEQVVNAGAINGAVSLAGGDDSFALALDTGSVGGLIEGGAGADALTLMGTGAFSGEDQSGFETLTVSGGGVATLSGAYADTQSLLVTDGAAAFLGDGASIGAANGAIVDAGATLGGSGAVLGNLTSDGLIDIGGAGTANPGALTVDGDFILSDAGGLLISSTGAATDRVIVGGAANLAGSVTVSLASGANFGLLPDTAIVIETGGGVTTGALVPQVAQSGVLTLTSTPVVSGGDVLIDFDVVSDFSGVTGLGGNGAATAGALDSGFAAAAPGSAFREALGSVSAVASVDALTPLSAEFYDVVTRSSVLSADRAMDDVFDRIQALPQTSSPGVWIAVGYEAFDRAGEDVFDYEVDQFTAAIGADVSLGSIVLGAAGSYADSDLDVATSPGEDDGDMDVFGVHAYASTTNATGFNLGAVVGYQFVDAQTQRSIVLPDLNSVFTADYSPNSFLAETRASYTQALGDRLVLRGGVALDLTIVQDESFGETGAGALGLAVETDTYEEFGGAASIDLMGRFGERRNIRPTLGGFVRRVFTDGAPEFTAAFLDAPTATFLADGSLDRTEYGVVAGLGMSLFNDKAILGASYRGKFSDNNDAQRASLNLTIAF